MMRFIREHINGKTFLNNLDTGPWKTSLKAFVFISVSEGCCHCHKYFKKDMVLNELRSYKQEAWLLYFE
jgi:hypothetical protein